VPRKSSSMASYARSGTRNRGRSPLWATGPASSRCKPSSPLNSLRGQSFLHPSTFHPTLTRLLGRLSNGTAVRLTGSWRPSPNPQAQSHELHVEEVNIIGYSDPAVCKAWTADTSDYVLSVANRRTHCKRNTRPLSTSGRCLTCGLDSPSTPRCFGSDQMQ
jgi:hypothetical protein